MTALRSHPDGVGAPPGLPPGFRLVTLREAGDALAHAMAIAAEAGAGTLVWVRRYDQAEFAVVLEPEEALATARRALQAGMNALADALAAQAPPQKPIGFRWPTTILIDGAAVGGCRLAWPPDADESSPPDWLVLGATVRTSWVRGPEPGHRPGESALVEEGFEALDTAALVESFARHLLFAIHDWQEQGFGPNAERWLARLAEPRRGRRGIAVNGDLLEQPASGGPPARRDLAAALRELATP